MARYEHTKIKQGKVIRGSSHTPYNITSYRTTTYNIIPKTDSDIYVITTAGDRLDNLAAQFYGDVNLWWYIAKANNLTFMTIPVGTRLRIPATIQYAIGT